MANVQISDLALATLPIDTVNTFFELQTIEAGIDVSRRLSAQDLGIGGGVTSVNSGVNITVDNTDPLNPIVNLDSVITNVQLDFSGSIRIDPAASGSVGIRSDGNTDTEFRIIFFEHQDGTNRAAVGHQTTSVFQVQNLIASGEVEIRAANAGLADTLLWRGDPDGVSSMYNAGTNVARTLTAGSGGFEINNTNTGGGFERALTVSDLVSGGVTVEDEGAPLATVADTLDFVGAGVTATGAGTTKTITIPGGGGIGGSITDNQIAVGATTANDIEGDIAFTYVSATDVVQLQSGAAFVRLELTSSAGSARVQAIDGSGLPAGFFIENSDTGAGGGAMVIDNTTGRLILQQTNDSGGSLQDIWVNMQRNAGVGLYHNNTSKLETVVGGIQLPDSCYIIEKAAANADFATMGQFWVRNDVPNVPMFTDDTGVDFQLGGGFDPSANQTITGDWDFQGMTNFENPTDDVHLGVNVNLFFRNDADDSDVFIQNNGPTINFGIAGGDFGSGVFEIGQSSFARVECPPLFIGEQAAAEADIGGDGQVWVRSDAPNTLMFTADDGVDFEVAGAARGVVKTGAATARSSTTTKTADPTFRVALGVGSYVITGILCWNESAGNNQGLRFDFSALTGTMDGEYCCQVPTENLNPATTFAYCAGSLGANSNVQLGDSTIRRCTFTAVVNVTVAGDFGLNWAQVLNDANATNVYGTATESSMVATKVA